MSPHVEVGSTLQKQLHYFDRAGVRQTYRSLRPKTWAACAVLNLASLIVQIASTRCLPFIVGSRTALDVCHGHSTDITTCALALTPSLGQHTSRK